MSRTLLVCSATGKQGGAVIKRLIAEKTNFDLLAVTRDANSASAQRLVQSSPRIKAVQGNLADPAGLFEAARKVASSPILLYESGTPPPQPIWGVFSVQSVMGFNQGGGGELGQGKGLIDKSIKAGVKYFVYSSVDRGGPASIHSATDIPHFKTKHEIEHHLINSTLKTSNKMDWTILRPVAFMENFTNDFFGRTFVTAWKMAVKNKPLQLIAVKDIGFFGAEAFMNTEQYKGRSLSLAGDELTIGQLGVVFKRTVGRDLQFTYKPICWLLMWAMKDFGLMFKWFYDVGYGADIGELKSIHPGLNNVEGWLKTESQFSKEAQK